MREDLTVLLSVPWVVLGRIGGCRQTEMHNGRTGIQLQGGWVGYLDAANDANDPTTNEI